jgi:hypothetical protein
MLRGDLWRHVARLAVVERPDFIDLHAPRGYATDVLIVVRGAGFPGFYEQPHYGLFRSPRQAARGTNGAPFQQAPNDAGSCLGTQAIHDVSILLKPL